MVYWRTGGALGGELNLANYSSKDHKWHFIGAIYTQEGTYKGHKSTRGPYVSRFTQDTQGSIHVAWVFKERAFAEEEEKKENLAEHGLFYAQRHDGGFTRKNN